jgi:ATP/maltotriose-dependent transcriptional regulator MalT
MSNHRFIDLEVVLATDSVISDPLSVREGDILGLIAQGLSNKEIARSLCIAPETVKTHVKHIFVKLASAAHHRDPLVGRNGWTSLASSLARQESRRSCSRR